MPPLGPGPQSGNTTNFTGCTGQRPITLAINWSPPGPQGGTSSFKFCYVALSILTNFRWPGAAEYTANINVLQSVILPNSTTWTFDYNDRDPSDPTSVNYGGLTKITLPTGGVISYTYTNISTPQCAAPASCFVPVSRYVSTRMTNANDGNGPQTWLYNWNFTGSQGLTEVVTVTDPLGNDTVYTNQNPWSGFINSEKAFQGSKATGTLLRTINTDWQLGSGVALPIRETTISTNGATTKTETDYSAIYYQVTEKRVYDYGNGTPGPLLRQTSTSFLATSNSSYLQNYLIDLPSAVTVTDGLGNELSSTTYGYDETLPASSGIVGSELDPNPPDGTARGNPTSVLRYLNTLLQPCPNGNIAGTNSYIKSTSTFFDTGRLQASADPCGNKTTYAYSSAYIGAYPTAVSNALGQITSFNYDLDTGQLVSKTDPNNQVTSYTYDPMWRLTSISYPDGLHPSIRREVYMILRNEEEWHGEGQA